MPETVIRTVGPGRDFATLAEFANTLPPSLVTVDQVWIAELSGESEDPGGAVFDAVCDNNHYIEVRAAPGQAFSDVMDPLSDPLTPTVGAGAIIRTVFGDALRAQGSATQVRLNGLQIVAEVGEAIVDDGTSGFTRLNQCLVEANGSGAAVTLRGSGVVRDSCIFQRGTGDGIDLAGTFTALTTTVAKPERPVASGTGIIASDGGTPQVIGCVVFGFGQAYGPDFSFADTLVSDQTNVLTAADNFANGYWTAIASTVDTQDTIPGPYNVPLQRLGNNTNAFARFDGQAFATVPPGEKVAFSAIVAQPTALVSAILLDSTAGRPEVRVTWSDTPPTVGLFGQTAALQLVTGLVTDLGGGAWRILLEAVNTTAAAVDVLPSFYVTRGVENTGLNVGMYAGAMMAGIGHLGNGFVYPDAVPGTNALIGIDPTEAIQDLSDATPDLRPIAGGPLDGAATQLSAKDIYNRARLSPDTAGGVSLNPAPLLQPGRPRASLTLDAVRLVDQNDILTAQQRRTVMPASPSRRIGV